jgi:hypothetical protein
MALSNQLNGDENLEPPKFTVLDAVMTLLAVVSVILVIADVFFRPALYERGWFVPVLWTDLAIALVFLVEFVYLSWGQGLIKHARENWFDLIGMVPLAAFLAVEAYVAGVPIAAAFTGAVALTGTQGAGILRFFRFFRVIRLFTAWSRFLRATNMTFGEQVAKRFFDKYRRIVVAELTTPILTAGLTVSQEVIIRMKFLDSIGSTLDAKRPEVHAAVLEALERNKVPQSVITQPLVERIVNQVEQAVLDAVVDTLTGPELNKVTQEAIVEVLQNFKDQLNSKEAKEALLNMS